MGNELYFSTLYIVTIFIIVLVLNILQRIRRVRLEKKISEFEKEKNMLINAPILNELSKVEALVKNNSLEKSYSIWEKKFEIARDKEIPKINDLIIEIDSLMEKKKYKKVLFKLVEVEIKIYEIRTKINTILEQIKDITYSEEKNRTTVTKLKAKYRDLKAIFEKTKADYGEFKNTIELRFEAIEKRFQEFEDIMEKNDYEEVIYIVKGLTEMINHMKIVVEEIPEIILMGKQLIPKRAEDVSTEYIKMIRNGYQLDFLNVEYNINEAEKKVSNIFDRVKVLNLEDVTFELKTILEYFDVIFYDFEKERFAKKDFEEKMEVFRKKNKHIQKGMDALFVQIPEFKKIYNFSDDNIDSLKLISNELNILNNDYKQLLAFEAKKTFPYSKLCKDLEIIILKLAKMQEKFNSLVNHIGSMKEDEERARTQLYNITNLLKQSRYKMRKSKLPVVADVYYIELNEAKLAIKEIEKELLKKPMDIDTLNIRVDTARDLVFKHFNTTNDIVRSALLAEHSIVYGNRYRSNKQNISDALSLSEKLFYEGNYKKSLETSVEAIDIIEPGIYKKILELCKE